MNKISTYIRQYLPPLILISLAIGGYFIFVKPQMQRTNDKFNNIVSIHLNNLSSLHKNDSNLSDKIDDTMLSFDKTIVDSSMFPKDIKGSLLVSYEILSPTTNPILHFEIVPSIYSCFFISKIKDNTLFKISYKEDSNKKTNTANCSENIIIIEYKIS